MRKNGRGHWDDDRDPLPVASTVFAVLAPIGFALLYWWLR